MTIRDILERQKLSNALIEFRQRAPYETLEETPKTGGILYGYALYVNGYLGPYDGDEYSLDWEVYDYFIEREGVQRPTLVVYMDAKYTGGA